MKTLLNTNLRQFLLYAILIAVCCAPLFYFLMKYSYSEDLDDLIIFRSEEFKEQYLPELTLTDIPQWNKYNEDMQIVLRDPSYPLDKPTQQNFFNKSEGHTIDYRIYYTNILLEGQPYTLVSRIPMIETGDLINMQVRQYGLLIAILLISLYFVQRFISRRLWTPFYSTLDKIKSFNLEKGDLPSFEKTNIKEFSQLNDNLDTLITNNVRTYTQQREFIENASHELQTPLAVFQTQLDILLQQPETTEKQMQIIQSLYTVSSRLTRLNKNLLLLAKIDNKHYHTMEQVDLSTIIRDQLFYFKYQADDRAISIKSQTDNSPTLTANRFLLESLVNNLIANSITHNVEGGTIRITTEDNRLTIINKGETTPLDPNKAFRRFSRTSEEKRGNGLGLSIVYQICNFHGWDITYDYAEGMHRFTVVFS